MRARPQQRVPGPAWRVPLAALLLAAGTLLPRVAAAQPASPVHPAQQATSPQPAGGATLDALVGELYDFELVWAVTTAGLKQSVLREFERGFELMAKEQRATLPESARAKTRAASVTVVDQAFAKRDRLAELRAATRALYAERFSGEDLAAIRAHAAGAGGQRAIAGGNVQLAREAKRSILDAPAGTRDPLPPMHGEAEQRYFADYAARRPPGEAPSAEARAAVAQFRQSDLGRRLGQANLDVLLIGRRLGDAALREDGVQYRFFTIAGQALKEAGVTMVLPGSKP
jgi:hypothetical protein